MGSSFFKHLSWFGRNRAWQRSSVERLRAERIMLDNLRRDLEQELAQLETERLRLVDEYRAALLDGSSERQHCIGRQFETCKSMLRQTEARHAMISNGIRDLHRLENLRENADFRRQGSSVLGSDLNELHASVEQELALNERHRQQLDDLGDMLEEAEIRASLSRDTRLTDAERELEALVRRQTGIGDAEVSLEMAGMANWIERTLDERSRAKAVIPEGERT